MCLICAYKLRLILVLSAVRPQINVFPFLKRITLYIMSSRLPYAQHKSTII